jgi:hypothetical protein
MDPERVSIAIIMSAGGVVLDDNALCDLPHSRVLHVELVVEELAACATVQLAHECSRDALRRALRVWSAARGWSVAVAPLPEGR